MKVRLTILCLFLLAPVLLLSCGYSARNSDFTIQLSGTQGLSFSGSYMVMTSNGQTASHSVNGTIPTFYSVSGTIVSCAFQKQTTWGTLHVAIFKNGQLVIESETTSPYGMVTVATP